MFVRYKACSNDSLQLQDQTLNFIKTHPLMDQSVPAVGGQPVLVHTGFQYVCNAQHITL